MMLRFAAFARFSSAALLLTLLGTTALSCKDESGITAIDGDDDDDDGDDDDDDDNEADDGGADDDDSNDPADDPSNSEVSSDASDDDSSPADDMPNTAPEVTEGTDGVATNAGNGGESNGAGGSDTGGNSAGGAGPAPTNSTPAGGGGDTTTPAPSGSGGSSGVAGSSNVGGGPVGVGGTAPATQCAPGVVDDFVSCDIDICAHEGRQGTWFYYGGSGIGIDETQAGVRIPPSTWSDQSCAMMLAGGDSLLSVDFYAGVGLALNEGLPYSLAGYSGITFTIETEAAVYLTLRNSLNEYFIPSTTSGQTVGLQSFSVPLSSFTARDDNPSAVLNLADVIELQWTVVNPELGFGLAIHSVSLY